MDTATLTKEEIMTRSLGFIDSMLEARGEISPMVYVHHDGQTITACPFKNQDEATEQHLKLVAVCLIKAARMVGVLDYVVQISEAWVSMFNPTDGEMIAGLMRPSEDPDRIECIIIEVRMPNGASLFDAFRMVRDGQTVRRDRASLINALGGQWQSWLDDAFEALR